MCEDIIPNCGCQEICVCETPPPCIVEPCVDGCIVDVPSDCVTLSEDLDICGEIITKGKNVTEALVGLASAVCDGVTITVQDMNVKVDAADTTTGFLKDKITVCENLTKAVTNVGGNETLELCAKIDHITGSDNNTLTSGPNGLYVAPSTYNYALSPLSSTTNTVTLAPVVGGQSIKVDAKLSTVNGNNNTLVDNGGLYVPPVVIPYIPTLSGGTTNSITTSVVANGPNFKVLADIIKDPASTATWSVSVAGVKIDCCAPVAYANTPITIFDPTGTLDCISATATGLDNHTLRTKVVVSGAAGNYLTATTAGLYCPTPAAPPATTINSSPTVLSTLVGVNTYKLDAKFSTDSCNNIGTGTDGALFSPKVALPFGLYINNLMNVFSFQGPSITNTDYEVQVQGLNGGPSWVTLIYSGISGTILSYTIPAPAISCPVYTARVRYKCGTNFSDWVAITKHKDDIITYTSDNGTIEFTPGVGCNTMSIDVVSPTIANPTWDNIWKAIPNGWWMNGAVEILGGAFYKIDANGHLHFRGAFSPDISIPNGYNTNNADFLNIASIYASLNPDTISTGNLDYFPAGISNNPFFIADLEIQEASITRTGAIFSYLFKSKNTQGAPVSNCPALSLSQIYIR